MHTKSFHGVKHSLTKNEMVILKSIALGLDCDTIRLLVEISEYQYQTLCKNIFSKLQVGNSYAAVQYAFKNGLLNQKEYNSEKIKGITLEFATQNIERLESQQLETIKGIYGSFMTYC